MTFHSRLRHIGRMAALAAMLCLSGCNARHDGGDAPVPRRTAYPRINTYPACYVTASVGHLSFDINSGASLSYPPDSSGQASGRWFDITYPRYGGAAMHCTFTATDSRSLRQVLDNRTERMALNTGGAFSEVTDLLPDAPGQFTAQLLVTPAESVTPIQFVASNGTNAVVSGALSFPGYAALNTDSIAPVIEAIKADMLRMLESLSIK